MLVVITYHFSKGSARRGCAGFNYDTAAARRHVFQCSLTAKQAQPSRDDGPVDRCWRLTSQTPMTGCQ